MTSKAAKVLALILMLGLLLGVPGCQKKEIASQAGYGAAGAPAGPGAARASGSRI